MVSWRDDCEEVGIDVLFRHGRKLVGAKHKMSVTRVTESQFADDVALYTKQRHALEQVSRKLLGMLTSGGRQ